MNRQNLTAASGDRDVVDQASLLDFLGHRDAYPDRPSSVEVIETHISWVFLTDRFAYKLKKPVVFDFLDFRSLEQRRRACEDELRLNRRLAPDVYLDLVKVTRDRRQRWRLGGNGPACEWLVQMRRLDADRTLEQRIRKQTLTTRDVDELSRRLVEFYRELPPVSLRTEHYRQTMEAHVRANLLELRRAEHGLPAGMVARPHAAQLRLLKTEPSWWDARVCDGRIVEGHGDLRPEHIYFHPQPLVIDAVEFNREFRTVDVLDELSFLAMECARLDAAWVGEQIVNRYCAAMGDFPPQALLRFYESYRACVRAKVCALRARQLTGSAADTYRELVRRYLAWADRFAADWASPLLLVVRGRSGVGKTVLATALADALSAQHLSTDVVRQAIGQAEPGANAVGYGAAPYRPADRQLVYEELLRRADELLWQGMSLVLDGTFLAWKQRQQAAEVAARRGAQLLVVECRCPESIAQQRVTARLNSNENNSDIRPEWLAQQEREEEVDVSALPSVVVDTTLSLPTLLQSVFAALRTVPLAATGASNRGTAVRPNEAWKPSAMPSGS